MPAVGNVMGNSTTACVCNGDPPESYVEILLLDAEAAAALVNPETLQAIAFSGEGAVAAVDRVN